MCSCKAEPTANDNDENWKRRLEKQKVIDTKPGKIAEFEEGLRNPDLRYIDDNVLYVIDRHTLTIYGYSRQDYGLTIKFGQQGEGAGEFKWINGFGSYPRYLFVNSTGKISFFSKNGKLEKEKKSGPGLIGITPVENNFVSFDYSFPKVSAANHKYSEIRIVLLNSKLEKATPLFNGKVRRNARFNDKKSRREILRFPDCTKFVVYKDRIYVGSSGKGFFFSVFAHDGEKLYDIDKPYEKRPVTEEEKEKTRKQIQNRGGKWKRLEVSFFEHYPAYKDFHVVDDKIYVFLYPKEEKETVFILNLEGQFLETVVIPTDEDLSRANIVHDGSLFYIKDNPETEKWELWELKF